MLKKPVLTHKQKKEFSIALPFLYKGNSYYFLTSRFIVVFIIQLSNTKGPDTPQIVGLELILKSSNFLQQL